MRACCAILVFVPLALGASVPRGQKAESSLTNSVSRLPHPALRIQHPPPTLSTPEPGTRSLGKAPSELSTAPAVNSGWSPLPFSHYEGILTRMPFGQPPPPPPSPLTLPQAPPPPPVFANKLVLCAINRSPSGAIAVGFVDGSANPPHSYYMDVGETEDGFTVVKADIDLEFTIIEKDGISVTLKLNAGPNAGANSTAASARDAAILAATTAPEKKPAAPAAAPTAPSKPMFSSATEQLLSMELSIPQGTESPPLPITAGLREDTHKALATVIVIETNDTDTVAAHKENVGLAKEELRTHIQEGGTAVSYLQTLKDRRDAEIARQKAAREAAEAQIRALAQKLSADEVKTKLDAINQNLSDTGVEPIDAPE